MAADAPQHLFNNLSLLHQLKPGSADFAKCIKENMFSKPNRTAFDQVLFYLCDTYDSARYLPTVPWPVLDRSQERTFRQNTVSFVKEIIKEVPEARIPAFSPSFLSTPGGERLTKFMWKFSLLVLKTVLDRENDTVFHYPTAGLHVLQNITDSEMEEFRQEVDTHTKLLIDSSIQAGKLSNDIVNQNMELKAIRTELSEILQRPLCPLTEEEKTIVLNGDSETSDAVFKRWQNLIDEQTEQAVTNLNKLIGQSVIIKNCSESVQRLVNSKTMPLVLDATDFPSSLKDGDGKLDLSFVLSEGARAATSLLNSVSMCGGFQPLGPILPQLELIRDQLNKAEMSLAETKAGFMELLLEPLGNAEISSSVENDMPDTPLKGSLQIGYEMLQDAQISTPPLVFDAHVDGPLKSRICAESPISQLPVLRKPFSKGGPIQKMGTPKSSCTKDFSGLTSTSFAAKNSISSNLRKEDAKPFKGLLNMKITDSPLVQTPAFCPKQIATSTAFKSSSALNMSKKPNRLPLPKKNTRKITSHQTPIAPVQEGPEDLSSSAMFMDEVAEGPELTCEEQSVCIEKPKDSNFNTNSPQLPKTPVSSPLAHGIGAKPHLSGPKNAVPFVTISSCQDEFDSPQSTCQMFSPPSANNSFFCLDAEVEIPASSVPKFDLDLDDNISPSGRVSLSHPVEEVDAEVEIPASSVPKFDLDLDDDISPSGRVSLCHPVEEATEKPTDTVEKSSRRKSLQALIHRYRDLKASSKSYEVPKLSPPVSPEPDLSEDYVTEEIDVKLDLNLDDLDL